MEKEIKSNLQAKQTWIRFAYMVLFAVIFFIVTWSILIVGAIAIIQFILNMVLGKPNKQLLAFSDSFSQYIFQIVKYLTFVTEDKPFPFGIWPHAKHPE